MFSYSNICNGSMCLGVNSKLAHPDSHSTVSFPFFSPLSLTGVLTYYPHFLKLPCFPSLVLICSLMFSPPKLILHLFVSVKTLPWQQVYFRCHCLKGSFSRILMQNSSHHPALPTQHLYTFSILMALLLCCKFFEIIDQLSTQFPQSIFLIVHYTQ